VSRRLYVASPVYTYGTDRYRTMVRHARRHFPRFSLVEPRHEFTSTSDWLRRWPDVLDTLDAIVAFGCIDNTIGQGVHAEVADAVANGVPVWWLTEDGGLVRMADVRIRRYPSLSRSMSHFARVYLPSFPKGRGTTQAGTGAMLGK
jgi:hypothetical protein